MCNYKRTNFIQKRFNKFAGRSCKKLEEEKIIPSLDTECPSGNKLFVEIKRGKKDDHSVVFCFELMKNERIFSLHKINKGKKIFVFKISSEILTTSPHFVKIYIILVTV